MKAKTEKIKLILLVVTTVAICLIIAAGTVFAWIAGNNSVSGKAKSINVVGRCEASFSLQENTGYTDFTSFDFGAIKCGGTKSFYIKLTNNDAVDYENINIRFAAPASPEEIPVYDNAVPYYLGSQLSVIKVWDKVGDTDGDFILSPGGDLMGAVDLYTVDLIGAGTVVIIEVTVKFVDDGTRQDVYQNFKANGGKCSRTIIVEYLGL